MEKRLVFPLIVVAFGLGGLAATVFGLGTLASMRADNADASADTHNPQPHDYIATPSGHSRAYRFTDDQGTRCYVVEGQTPSVALSCDWGKTQ